MKKAKRTPWPVAAEREVKRLRDRLAATERPADVARVISTTHGVTIALENGVTLAISSNPGYFHLHLTGTAVPGHAQANVHAPRLDFANDLDVSYTAVPK